MRESGMSEPICSFATLPLNDAIQRALKEKNYLTPSPIQQQAIPHLLEGRDLIGCAQTGTGKTAAFALPILHRLAASAGSASVGKVRALVLTPTRELAGQIGESFAAYGKYLGLRHTVIFGGVGQNPQVTRLRQGVEILVATPGRLLDLMNQGLLSLQHVEVFVLDEADRMLDMGFLNDVKKIMAKLPARRQSLLFSATMPEPIQKLATGFLHNPVRIEVTPVSSTAEKIRQEVRFVGGKEKIAHLVALLQEQKEGLVLVFVKMKHRANRVVEQLARCGIGAVAIHGNKSQTARERALEQFRSGESRVLVATDIAARGIDVKGITLVVNFDIPNEPESYVHRIGRTARAGAVGVAVALCDPEERQFLKSIERLIQQSIPVGSTPNLAPLPEGATLARPQQPRRPFPRGGRGAGGGQQERRAGDARPGNAHRGPRRNFSRNSSAGK